MQGREISPEGWEFQPGSRLAESLFKFLPEDFLSSMDWLMMDSFSPTFKWIVPSTSMSISWSCEIEVSHIGKKPFSYRKMWEKIFSRIEFTPFEKNAFRVELPISEDCL